MYKMLVSTAHLSAETVDHLHDTRISLRFSIITSSTIITCISSKLKIRLNVFGVHFQSSFLPRERPVRLTVRALIPVREHPKVAEKLWTLLTILKRSTILILDTFDNFENPMDYQDTLISRPPKILESSNKSGCLF